jgi:predicted signal transduction protein with EAL and GGDEF domain
MSAPDDAAADPMRRADIAMYQAKRNGRDRCEVFAGASLLDFAEISGSGADPA